MPDQKPNADGLEYVKQFLPVDLHRYAHLIPLTVNAHVSWLEPERLKEALVVGIIAFKKAAGNRKEDMTDGEFGQYIKLCVYGAVMNEFKTDIAERKDIAEYNRGQDTQLLQKIVLVQSDTRTMEYFGFRNDHNGGGEGGIEESGSIFNSTPEDEQPAVVNTNTFGRLQHRSATTISGIYKDDFEEEDDYYDCYSDEKYLDYLSGISSRKTIAVTDSLYMRCWDGDDDYTRRAVELGIVPQPGNPYELLPSREKTLLDLFDSGHTVTDIAKREGCSKARISQLLDQAIEREAKYQERLDLGETFDALLVESRKANAISAKKQAGNIKKLTP